MKTIFRTNHATHFTTLPNGLLRDKQLSFRARGVLAMVLSNSEEWEVTQVWLREQGAEGKEAIAASIRELEAAGYAVFDQERRGGGAFSQGVWTFYDAPVAVAQRTTKTALKEPPIGLPPTGLPVGGKPHDGNPATKKDYPEEGLSKEENQKTSAPSAAVASDACLPTFGDMEQMQAEPQQEKKVPSFTTEFIAAWCEAFLSVRGEKYLVCKGKDHAAAKRIASIGIPVADLIVLARRAWASSGPNFWRCEKAITISFFVGSFNEIRSELSAKPTTSNAIHSKNPSEHPRNRFIAGAGSGPPTSEIIKRNNERAAAERAAREVERVPAPVGPVAGEVAPVEQHPSESFASV